VSDHRDSRYYHCTHVTPRGRRCKNTIQVLGAERTHFAALARVGWFLRGGGNVYCRLHAKLHAPGGWDDD
jgi:hypothetical protein